MSDAARVIFVNRVYWPATAATAQLLTDLAEGLAVRGWSVHVIAAGQNDSERNGVSIHRTGTPVEHGGLLARALSYRRFARTACSKLAGLARPGDIVVAMTDPPLLGAAVTRTLAARGARVIHWVQDIYPEIAAAHFGPLAGLALTPLTVRRNHAWRRAAACVTLGEDMSRMIADQDVARDRITVIPNWAPRELHTPAPESEVAAHRFRWGLADKFIVAYSGNLGRVHEFATILAAADLLRDRPAIVFLFIGNGARFETVADRARSLSLTNVRLFPPEPRSGLTTSLRAADAHFVSLLPAYARLVYPSKLAGVLAAGRPVLFIGPAEGEIARLIRAHECGSAVVPGAAGELAGCIRRLADETAARQHQAARARALYEQKFAGDAALTAWDQLLRRAAGT